ncbi:MAG: substrate-binding domain-containing protein, partial [Chloroflexota bacterium]
HVLAMFGPSFFTGSLIARFGKERIVSIGLSLLAGCSIVALMGIELAHFWTALVLLGLGWNFGFIGATDMLTANPDIDVIASVGDQMILGAELAVQDAGLEGEVALIGQGGNIDAYEAVVEGRWFATIANIPYTNGRIAGQMALQALDGSLIVTSVNMYDQSPPYPASGAIITAENAADFTPEW